MLEKIFHLKENHTDVKTELINPHGLNERHPAGSGGSYSPFSFSPPNPSFPRSRGPCLISPRSSPMIPA